MNYPNYYKVLCPYIIEWEELEKCGGSLSCKYYYLYENEIDSEFKMVSLISELRKQYGGKNGIHII